MIRAVELSDLVIYLLTFGAIVPAQIEQVDLTETLPEDMKADEACTHARFFDACERLDTASALQEKAARDTIVELEGRP